MTNDQKITSSQLADALDRALLDAIENGVEVLDQKTGALVKIAAPAKFLETAIKRLDQLGMRDPAVDGTPAGQLTNRIHKHLKLTGSKDPLRATIDELDQQQSA